MEEEQFAELKVASFWNWKYEVLHFVELFLAALVAIELYKVV